LYLIKSCENYNLDERDWIESINKVLGDKSICRRTYYNYKKKLYDNQIFDLLKNSCYNTIGVRLFILDSILDDWEQTKKADKLIGQQFPKRKQILEDEEKHTEELDKVMDKVQAIINNFQEMETRQSHIVSTLPSNHTIREEFVRCGKEFCTVSTRTILLCLLERFNNQEVKEKISRGHRSKTMNNLSIL
jgi:hypothetical protein